MKTRWPFLPFVLAASLLAAGCTANRRQAGTGDVAFRLIWNHVSDLDLYVEDPSGVCISFALRQSPSGGVLDVDCNGSSDTPCEHPVENVFWPPATAPAGDYRFWVRAHSLVPGDAVVPFRLHLLRGKEVFWLHEGSIRNQELAGPFFYTFPSGKGARLLEKAPLPSRCGVVYFPEESRAGTANDYGKIEGRQLLLPGKILIYRDEDIEAPFGRSQKVAVFSFHCDPSYRTCFAHRR
jgi:hypothetical protein